jgi:hypothetical protein
MSSTGWSGCSPEFGVIGRGGEEETDHVYASVAALHADVAPCLRRSSTSLQLPCTPSTL